MPPFASVHLITTTWQTYFSLCFLITFLLYNFLFLLLWRCLYHQRPKSNADIRADAPVRKIIKTNGRPVKIHKIMNTFWVYIYCPVAPTDDDDFLYIHRKIVKVLWPSTLVKRRSRTLCIVHSVSSLVSLIVSFECLRSCRLCCLCLHSFWNY